MTAAIMGALAEYLGAIELPGHADLLESDGSIYVPHIGEVDDRAIIGLVERWAMVRRRHPNRRITAVLTAESLQPRYTSILAVIAKAVPLIVLEMNLSDGDLRFTSVDLL